MGRVHFPRHSIEGHECSHVPNAFAFTLATSSLAPGEAPPKPSVDDLLKAATTPPAGHGVNDLPSLSKGMRELIELNEIAREPVRRAFELLDAKRRNVDWFKAVKTFEEGKAIWSLQACLVHPHEDVQIEALRAIERMRNKDAAPFLLIYGYYKAYYQRGSEAATIHGIVHESIAKTLSAIPAST